MAIISDMSQPLGYAIGNALEVKEAIDTKRKWSGRFKRALFNAWLTNGLS